MKKQYIVGIIALALIGGVVIYTKSSRESATNTTSTEQGGIENQYPAVPGTPETSVEGVNSAITPETNTSAETQKIRAFTLGEVQTHNSVSDCYSIVRDGVYDLTTWISKHPGGEKAILSICGKDGTTAFEGVHDGKEKQEAQLKTFYIGVYNAE